MRYEATIAEDDESELENHRNNGAVDKFHVLPVQRNLSRDLQRTRYEDFQLAEPVENFKLVSQCRGQLSKALQAQSRATIARSSPDTIMPDMFLIEVFSAAVRSAYAVMRSRRLCTRPPISPRAIQTAQRFMMKRDSLMNPGNLTAGLLQFVSICSQLPECFDIYTPTEPRDETLQATDGTRIIQMAFEFERIEFFRRVRLLNPVSAKKTVQEANHRRKL